MRKINKKGQTINLITGTVLGLMILFFLIFAVLFGVASLNPESFFTAGSNESLAVGEFQTNVTAGVSSFAGKIPTVFLILGVVLAIAAIVILVLYVKRMRDSGGSGGAAL